MLVSLLLLLPLLAILQYRWIGEVSEADRQRMAESVNTAAIRFAEDFNSQITRALFTFQIRGGANADDLDDLAERYTQRYNEWAAATSYPQLVKRAFIARRTDSGAIELLGLDPQAGTLAALDWPEDLTSVRTDLERRPNVERGAGSPRLQMRRFSNGDNPVAVLPIVSGTPAPASPRPQVPGSRRPMFRGISFQTSGWSIVEFDRKYLLQEFVPTLINRYFQPDGSSSYRLAILSHDGAAQLIYRSDPDITLQDLQPADVAINIFSPESGRGRRAGSPGPGRGQGGFGGPPGPSISGTWQLIAKHRAGSLDLAVASVRRRNLAVSFGILLILGGSVVMIVISSHRAHTLAQLQMDFVARVSHELRTPLAIIRSAAYNVLSGVVSNEKDVREYARIVGTEGQRLSAMVDQILLFSKMESGHSAYDLQPVDVEEIVEQAIRTMSASIDAATCTIDRHIPPHLPVVKADAVAVTQCLQNLISNAIKYGRRAGIAHIEVEASANAADHTVRISVIDQGLGIDSSDLPQIFEPFYRGKNARSDIPGSGLGLNLVRRLITGQGGRVTVESKVGEGTRFTMHLPEMPEMMGSSG